MMLKKKIVLDDMQCVVCCVNFFHILVLYHNQDVEFYNSLKYILDNDPEPLCLQFTTTKDHFGEVVDDIIFNLHKLCRRLVKWS